MTSQFSDEQIDYIKWQNRATRFYISARILHANYLSSAAVFCAQQSLELLLKATLIYWDRSFEPTRSGHKFKSMLNTLNNKVPDGKADIIPSYFYHKRLYQSTSRYPDSGGSIGIFNTFIPDLDKAIADLVELVPFQFNSELFSIFARPGDRNKHLFSLLARNNTEVDRLRHHILSSKENIQLVRSLLPDYVEEDNSNI